MRHDRFLTSDTYMKNSHNQRSSHDLALLNKGPGPDTTSQTDAEPEDNPKLASVTADQRKLIETLQSKMMKEKGLIDEKTYQQALALVSNAHDGRRQKGLQSEEQLRNRACACVCWTPATTR